ncbi:MAG: ABC transporter substrate-binding protein [Silvania sp.]|uniref:ABC transporter substrate-binding protein n=1 Tax=Silvania sp. TaxID=3016633 RepID=UPI003EE6B792
MKKTSLIKWMVSTFFCLFIVGCGPEENIDPESNTGSLKMWVAPNENEEAFWAKIVKEWNNNPKNMRVEFTTIPAAGSSEEAIMNALASGTEPDISSNIFIGFASQLTELNQIANLAAMPGYSEVIKNRHMEAIMPAWEINGQQNVLPLYVNPIVWWWRGDLLAKYGFKHIPLSYDDIYKLAKLRAADNKGYVIQMTAGKNWWERWFDLIPLLYAQTGGKAYIDDKQATFSSDDGRKVLTFMGTIFHNGWSSYDFTSADDPLASGQVLASARGPWDIARYRKQYPEVLKTIKIGPMLTEKGEAHPHTFGDSKGLVIFNSSKHKTEAWAFVQWVFTQAEHDRSWLEMTGMPPARSDLLINPLFVDYFAKNPVEKDIASWVNVALPPVATTKTTEIQRSMTQMLEQVIFNKVPPEAAIKQSAREINGIIQQ